MAGDRKSTPQIQKIFQHSPGLLFIPAYAKGCYLQNTR